MRKTIIACAAILCITGSLQAAVFWSESFESANLGQFTDCYPNPGYWLVRSTDAPNIQCDSAPAMPCDGIMWAHGDTYAWNSSSTIDLMWAGPIDLTARTGRIDAVFCYLTDEYYGYGDELYFYASCTLPASPCNPDQWNLLWSASGGCTTGEVTVDLTSLVGCHASGAPDCEQVYIAFGYPGLHYRGVGVDNVRLVDDNACLNQYDWGDAPDPTFPTLASSNGAMHLVVPGMSLGMALDSESDGNPSTDAAGDDDALQDDEDGVTFSPGTEVMLGTAITLSVTVSQPGYVSAWADLNCNGSWNEGGELFAAGLPVVTGTQALGVITPIASGSCYVRVRYSTTAGLSHFGLAPNGEVEDYRIVVNALPLVGDDCDNPITATFPAELPYHDEMTTCTLQAEYNSTCLGGYDSAEDVIYELVLTEDMCLSFTLTGDIDLIAMALDTGCPPAAVNCAASCQSAASYTCSIPAHPIVAGTYYLMIDNFAPPGCIPNYTLDIIECPTSPFGDTCVAPAYITCGECVTGTTLGAVDNFDCNGTTAGFDGPDVVYELTLDAETMVTIRGEAAFNADWAISHTCSNSAADMLCTLDSTVTSGTVCSEFYSNPSSDLYYSGLLAAGIYYIWVDGYSASDLGPYALEVDCATETPAGDTCADAIPIPVNGPQIVNDNCYPYTNVWTVHSGNDVFYRLDLTSSYHVTICLSAGYDTYLTLLESNCSTVIARDDDTECTGIFCDGALPQANNSSISRVLTPGVYYIVAESNLAADCGPFCLDVMGYVVNTSTSVMINEVDVDTAGSPDQLEFVELFDGGFGMRSLDNMVLVFYDGSSDSVYYAIDLDSHATSPDGFFLLGNPAVSPIPNITFPNNTMRNNACAVALFWGHSFGFPNGSPVTTTGLIDALVYDVDYPDDTSLLRLLYPGQPQINENQEGTSTNVSMMRCPDGAGGMRITTDYYVGLPSAAGPNTTCPALRTPTPTLPPTAPPTATPQPVPSTSAGSISILLIALGAMLLIARRR